MNLTSTVVTSYITEDEMGMTCSMWGKYKKHLISFGIVANEQIPAKQYNWK